MNQRFSELKQLAHDYAVDQEWYIDSFEQRFAELIVLECAKIADTKQSHDAGCGYITKTIGTRIREHFDIK